MMRPPEPGSAGIGAVVRPDRSASPERRFVFRIHMLLVAGGIGYFLSVIGWLVWRIVAGEWFALALGCVVSALLFSIMVVAMRAMTIIALDGVAGRSRRPPGGPVRAQLHAVSAGRWVVGPRQTLGAAGNRGRRTRTSNGREARDQAAREIHRKSDSVGPPFLLVR